MDANGITPVMNVGNGDGMWGGSGFTGLFALLILLGMFNGGFGFGNNGYNGNANAIQNDVNRGFDYQNMMANQRETLTAVNDASARGIAATNQVYHDVVATIADKYGELTRDIAGVDHDVERAIANQSACCCDIKQLLQATSANTDAQIATAKYETAMQMAGMEARLTQKMDANEITSLRDKVNELQMAQATAGMLRFPQSWSYGAGPFPPIFGGCYGQNNI